MATGHLHRQIVIYSKPMQAATSGTGPPGTGQLAWQAATFGTGPPGTGRLAWQGRTTAARSASTETPGISTTLGILAKNYAPSHLTPPHWPHSTLYTFPPPPPTPLLNVLNKRSPAATGRFGRPPSRDVMERLGDRLLV
jgi:hypothetical protein